MVDAIRQGGYERYDQLRLDQKKFGRFRPWMTHSQTEKSPTAVFHWQLLQDYATIDELGRKMLDELDSHEKRRKPHDRRGAVASALREPRVWFGFAALAILIVLGALYWASR